MHSFLCFASGDVFFSTKPQPLLQTQSQCRMTNTDIISCWGLAVIGTYNIYSHKTYEQTRFSLKPCPPLFYPEFQLYINLTTVKHVIKGVEQFRWVSLERGRALLPTLVPRRCSLNTPAHTKLSIVLACFPFTIKMTLLRNLLDKEESSKHLLVTPGEWF